MSQAKAHHPTTIRLSPSVKRRLEAAAAAQKRSQSFIIEQALDAHLLSEDRLTADIAERLASWQSFLDETRRHVTLRTAEEIDADIREMREDRTDPFGP